ncbi:MAG TPA: PH domain-containing protein, partial [Candidatus Saccharimonadales bacterium]|nr:PH domain-containing protein [Candidatus Saccharimonadales bacterium]
MSYARNLLSRGEEVVFESRQHWLAVLGETWPFVVVSILALAVAIWLGTNPPLVNPTVDGIVTIVVVVALIVSLGRIGMRIWGWRNQEYLVTTRRLIKSEGVFNKDMSDSALEKVNDAHLTQSWLGRIFDFGTLDIMTASEESAGIQDYVMLADPVKFKIAMMNQKERLERPDLAPPPRMQGAPAVPEMQRADAMPPRAGSDRVAQVPASPASAQSAPPPAQAPAAPSPGDQLAATL